MELLEFNRLCLELMIYRTEQRKEEIKAENQIKAIQKDPLIRKV